MIDGTGPPSDSSAIEVMNLAELVQEQAGRAGATPGISACSGTTAISTRLHSPARFRSRSVHRLRPDMTRAPHPGVALATWNQMEGGVAPPGAAFFDAFARSATLRATARHSMTPDPASPRRRCVHGGARVDTSEYAPACLDPALRSAFSPQNIRTSGRARRYTRGGATCVPRTQRKASNYAKSYCHRKCHRPPLYQTPPYLKGCSSGLPRGAQGVDSGHLGTWQSAIAGSLARGRELQMLMTAHAQQESFATSFVNVCPASLIPSAQVRYGCRVETTS